MCKPWLRAQPLEAGAQVRILVPPLTSGVTLDRYLWQFVLNRVAFRVEGVKLGLRFSNLSVHQNHLEGRCVRSGAGPEHLHFPKFPGDAAAADLGTKF